ncbi:hypothetical protein [Paraburkholderia sp. MM5477-R1]|uniref:hypothetical protein n=1 Tax=Paraburkholderia sp. MM5477-R1 TaxID=2991062 RepID=UPI003D209CB6
MSDTGAMIEAAFRKLNIEQDAEQRLRQIVHTLSLIPKNQDGTPPPEFRLKGRKACRDELDKVAELAGKLAAVIDGLGEPSIGALADSGLMQIVHHNHLSATLKRVAAIAHQADVSNVPENQGRGRLPNNLARGVVAILAHDYATLTGRRPTVGTRDDGHQAKPYGPFYDLVTDIFQALEIDASAESSARAAALAFKEEKSQ